MNRFREFLNEDRNSIRKSIEAAIAEMEKKRDSMVSSGHPISKMRLRLVGRMVKNGEDRITGAVEYPIIGEGAWTVKEILNHALRTIKTGDISAEIAWHK